MFLQLKDEIGNEVEDIHEIVKRQLQSVGRRFSLHPATIHYAVNCFQDMAVTPIKVDYVFPLTIVKKLQDNNHGIHSRTVLVCIAKYISAEEEKATEKEQMWVGIESARDPLDDQKCLGYEAKTTFRRVGDFLQFIQRPKFSCWSQHFLGRR